MMTRCNSIREDKQKVYANRGITVCEEWKNYQVFKKWALSNGFKKELTLDRTDNNIGYSPSNCRWTTHSVQIRNQRVLRSTNTSGFKGVSKSGRLKWKAMIELEDKGIYLGTFEFPWTAAYAYDSYVLVNNLEHSRNFDLNCRRKR